MLQRWRDLLQRYPRYPVELEGGLQFLQPVEYIDYWMLRVYDPESDAVIMQGVPHWTMTRAAAEPALDAIITRMFRQLDAAAWALRKYDIPPSWETAYYRACGEWPPGFA